MLQIYTFTINIQLFINNISNFMNRRSFGLTTIAGALASITTQFTGPKPKKEMKNIFVHHVYFWLANPNSTADKAQLTAALQKLAACKSIKNYHLGTPASTSRDVIDGSYTISWLTIFATAADEAKYQVDPIHLAFVEQNKHLWSKVVVYDSIDAI
jgi:hypothetical protein